MNNSLIQKKLINEILSSNAHHSTPHSGGSKLSIKNTKTSTPGPVPLPPLKAQDSVADDLNLFNPDYQQGLHPPKERQGKAFIQQQKDKVINKNFHKFSSLRPPIPPNQQQSFGQNQ